MTSRIGDRTDRDVLSEVIVQSCDCPHVLQSEGGSVRT